MILGESEADVKESPKIHEVPGSLRFWFLWVAATVVPWAVGQRNHALALLLSLALLGLFGLALILELIPLVRNTVAHSPRGRWLRLLMLAVCASTALVVNYVGFFTGFGGNPKERQRTGLIWQLEEGVKPNDLIEFAQSLAQTEGLGNGRITNRLVYKDARLTGLKEAFGRLPIIYYFADRGNTSNVFVRLDYPGGVAYYAILVVLGNSSEARLDRYPHLTHWTNQIYVSFN